jgi:hypothetical protein
VRNTSSVSKNAVTLVTIYELAFILCATVARKLIRSRAREREIIDSLFMNGPRTDWVDRCRKEALVMKAARRKTKTATAAATHNLYLSLDKLCARSREVEMRARERDV